MYLTQSLIISLLEIILVATASSTKNYFTSPASNTGINPVFTLGDKLLVSWVTELGEFNVSFWQQSLVQQSAASQGNIYAKIHASDKVTDFTWVVQLYGFDLSYSNVFFLWVNPDGPDGFVSTYFNITEPTTTTTTTAIASTATSINTPNLASPRSSASVSASSSFESAPSSSTLTSTSKIALGVGIGVGVPILCALGVIIWLKPRKASKNLNKEQMAGPTGTMPVWPIMQQHHISPPFQLQGMQPNELHNHSSTPYELENSPYK